MLGEYNLPNLNFNFDLTDLLLMNSRQINNFITKLISLNLYQHNHIKNSLRRILDLVFSNLNFIDITEAIESLLKPDEYHPASHLSIPISSQIRSQGLFVIFSYNFNCCDYTSLKAELNTVDWNAEFSGLNIDDCIQFFYSVVYGLIDKYTPKRIIAGKSFPPWFSKDLIDLISEKKKYHVLYKSTRSLKNYMAFSALRARCKSMLMENKKRYTKNIENAIKVNSKAFWKYVNLHSNTKKL